MQGDWRGRARDCENSVVRAEGNAADLARIPEQERVFRKFLEVMDHGRAVDADRAQHRTVGPECDRLDRARMPDQRLLGLRPRRPVAIAEEAGRGCDRRPQ